MNVEGPKHRKHRQQPVLIGRAREMRRQPSAAEQKLWYRLRDKRLCRFKFRRQYAIGPFIADFYCAAAKLVIEVDGDSHGGEEPEAYDAERTQWLERNGIRVVRYWNHDVLKNAEGTIEDILRICEGGPIDS